MPGSRTALKLIALLAVATVAWGCAKGLPETPAPLPSPTPPELPPPPGAPVFVPAELPPVEPAAPEAERREPLEVHTGTASYYADRFHQRRTASGQRYDRNELVAAHRSFPFGTVLRVTNLANDRVVTVRVIDRGPFIKGRILDLSRRAAEELKFIGAGLARVRIEVLEYGVLENRK